MGGTRAELIELLSNHDMLQSRAFSIAMRRINSSAFSEKPSTRRFNTSRAQKAVKDFSPVDLVYMPNLADLEVPFPRLGPSIPILFSQLRQDEPRAVQMKPQINTVGAIGSDASASPMSEVVDNDAMDIDPFSLTETVARSREGEELQRESRAAHAQRQKSVVQELWSGFLDDLLGPDQRAEKPLRK